MKCIQIYLKSLKIGIIGMASLVKICIGLPLIMIVTMQYLDTFVSKSCDKELVTFIKMQVI